MPMTFIDTDIGPDIPTDCESVAPAPAEAATSIGADDDGMPLTPGESLLIYALICLGCVACFSALAWAIA